MTRRDDDGIDLVAVVTASVGLGEGTCVCWTVVRGITDYPPRISW